MKELKAQHPTTGQIIVERFDGKDRYIKVSPYTPLYFNKMKEAMADKPVIVYENPRTKWIKITKINTDLKDERLEKAGKAILKKIGKDENEFFDIDTIIEAESKMLKSQGFIVQITGGEE